jgi:hypothetical protein
VTFYFVTKKTSQLCDNFFYFFKIVTKELGVNSWQLAACGNWEILTVGFLLPSQQGYINLKSYFRPADFPD